MHHEDSEGHVAMVSDQAPFFRNKIMFADPRQEKFVNHAEKRILLSNEWPDGYKKFKIEG